MTNNQSDNRRHRKTNFTFSMIGLCSGDYIVFDPLGIKVQIVSEKKVKHDDKNWTLTGFCQNYLPIEMRNVSGSYQGPKYFSYEGKNLCELRFIAENT